MSSYLVDWVENTNPIKKNTLYVVNNKLGFAVRLPYIASDIEMIEALNIDKQTFLNLTKKHNGTNRCSAEFPSTYFENKTDAYNFMQELIPYTIINNFL